jgi:xanthine/CO dehydrogenase XdhC/CoxF family maturation factor
MPTATRIGTVSGGCLEADVLERAKRVLQTGEAAVVTYDTKP